MRQLVSRTIFSKLKKYRDKYIERKRHASMLKERKLKIENMKIFPCDSFLVSYPKSGNTWLRFLVLNLLYPGHGGVSFEDIEKLAPDIYPTPNHKLEKTSRPRILKSHECYTDRYPKVIYLVRDPRDVAVSFYHYMLKTKEITEGVSIETWIKGFLKGSHYREYGSWERNTESWLKHTENSSRYLLLKYEDLLEEPASNLEKVAHFLGITASQDTLENSIAMSSAQKMRQLEILEKPFINTRDDKLFVRSASSGNWREDLSHESIRKIERAWARTMKKLGYIA